MTRSRTAISCFFIILLLVPGMPWAAGNDFVFMAGTIGPIDSGIITLLEDQFEKDTGARVRHVGAGTGVTLDIALFQ